ncbi:uncharacterized protein LOC128219342 [Mya arenaria]|uniref:uncharacterized protein LOC128219342 n=3 Tax=Mya arenaria TaxID=6604 RepID=UPI0022DF8E72|nr:uncharacterized protein LOC128219342 [Mya arenaria]
MFESMTYTARRNIVIFGGFLIHLCLGSFYAFGNISPYIMSYLRNRTQETWLVNTQNSWIMNAAAISAPIGSITGSYIERNHGVRIAVGIGCVLFCSGVLLTYFAIQRSLYIVALTYGFITNLGTFMAYGPPVQNAAKWMPARPALAVGLIVGGFGLGAFVFNLIITYYINPDNIQINDNDYFTDQALLDRVPRVFFLLAGIYIALQVIGVFLTSPVPPENDHIRVSRMREDQPSGAVDDGAASSDRAGFDESVNIFGDEHHNNDQAQTVWGTVKEIFVNKDAWKIHLIILFVYAGMQVVHSYYKVCFQYQIAPDDFGLWEVSNV